MVNARAGVSLLVFLWIAFALNYVDRQMVYSMFPALQAELGFEGARLGLIGSVFQWVYTLSMPLAGRMADMWRKDLMIVGSLVLWSAATFGCGLSGSQTSFLGWRAVMGLTESLYYPAALALIAGAYPSAARSRALGIHQTAQMLGVVIGGWYGGWAADHVGWRQAFQVAASIGIVYSVVLWLGLRRGGEPASAAAPSRAPADWRALFRSRDYLALCGVFASYCAMQWIFFAWFPVFLYERFHLSMTESGWNATVFIQGSTILGILTGGALADVLRRRWRSGRFQMAALGVFGCAPFAYLTFATYSLDLCRIYSAAFGLFGGFLAANAFAAAYDVIEERNRGLAGGVLNMTGGISSAATIYLAGALKDSIGFSGLMLWVVAVALAASLLLSFVAARRAEVLTPLHQA